MHWKVRGPLGRDFEWDTRVVEDRPGRGQHGSRSRGRPCRARARSASARAGRPGHGGHPPHSLQPAGRGPRPGGREAPGLRAQAVRRAGDPLLQGPRPRPARSPPPTGSRPHAPTPAEEDIPMRALYWNGVNDLRVETVPDPTIVNPHDAILQVTMSTTCGSDLHFIDGYIPTMKPGDVIGHEFMGEVVETRPRGEEGQEGRPRGRPVLHRLRPVLVLQEPALLAVRQHASRSPSCRSPMFGYPTAGIYGYTHAFGGYAGSHAAVRPRARSPTTTASRCPRACPTSRCCSSPTPPRPATWGPTSATSSPATRSPSGAAAASG